MLLLENGQTMHSLVKQREVTLDLQKQSLGMGILCTFTLYNDVYVHSCNWGGVINKEFSFGNVSQT